MCIGYMQIPTLFYICRLEHLQILVLGGGESGTSPPRIPGDFCILQGRQKFVPKASPFITTSSLSFSCFPLCILLILIPIN